MNRLKEGEVLMSQAARDAIDDETRRLRAALSGLVEAWDSLKPGFYSDTVIEKWLRRSMKPAVDKAREVL